MAMRRHRPTTVSLAVIAVTLCFVKAPANADELVALHPRSGVITVGFVVGAKSV
jgi:hypothetical protein